MAWNPNIPTVTNRVQDDLDAIRQNFEALDGLPQDKTNILELAGEKDNILELAGEKDNILELAGEKDNILGHLADTNNPHNVQAQQVPYSSGVSGFTPATVKAALDALAGVRIVEMGTNANGTYVRWENGLQVCYVRIGGLGPIDSSWGSLYTFSAGVQWTFPASFVSIPVVVAFPGSTNEFAAIAYQQTHPITSSYVSLSLARGTASDRTDFVIAAIAIGAWK